MIMNAWTVLAFFLAGFSALVSLALVVSSLRARLRHGSSWDASGPLLSLLLGALVAVELVGLPHPYWLLKSYVPALGDAGAMCAYGVATTHPQLVGAMLALGPLTVWVGGLWFVASSAAGMKQSTLRPGLPLLAGVFGLLYSGTEALYLFAEKGADPVTCCSQALSAAAGPSSPTYAGSASSMQGWSGPVAYGAASLAMLLLVGALARRSLRRTSLPTARVILVSMAAASSAVHTFFFWRDHLAPKVLELPYHHCVFELLTDTRALWVAAAFLAAGYGMLLWPPALLRKERGAAVSRSIHRAALLALLSGQLIVLVHWPAIR